MTTKLLASGVLFAALGGCMPVQGGNGYAMGAVYAGYKMGGAIGTGESATKTGEACAKSVMGIASWGDASVQAAKQAGGITTVAHVDHDTFNVLGVYGKTCTVVVGN